MGLAHLPVSGMGEWWMCDWGPEEEWRMEGSKGRYWCLGTRRSLPPPGRAGTLLWAQRPPAFLLPKAAKANLCPLGASVITLKGKPTPCHKGTYVPRDTPSRRGGAGWRGQPSVNGWKVFLCIRMNDAQGINGVLWVA